MPRLARPPYLYLKPADKKNSATWVIRHAGKMLYTGASELDSTKAQAALVEYLRVNKPTPHKPNRTPDSIYFATCDVPDFPIKIGASSNPEWRIHKMQTMMPYKVVLLAILPGCLLEEKELHLRFRDCHLRGEWFSRSAELLALISTANGSGSAPLIPLSGVSRP